MRYLTSGTYNGDYLDYFRFIGRICGMAIYHNRLIAMMVSLRERIEPSILHLSILQEDAKEGSLW